MRSTGIVRKIDELGRVVIPMEMRRSMTIEDGDAFEIFVDEDRIVLSKYTPLCCFCGGGDDLAEYHGKKICKPCRTEIGSR
jgi:transcriptional pleiotropic regulator of transition state genes